MALVYAGAIILPQEEINVEIKEALSKLDPANDGQWTSNGAPLMDALIELTGNPSITRKMVTNAAPDFTRETAVEVNVVNNSGAQVDVQKTHDSSGVAQAPHVHTSENSLSKPVSVALSIDGKDENPVKYDELTDDDIIAMQLTKIFSDYELTVRYSQVISRICGELSRELSERQDKLKAWSQRSEAVDRVIIKMERNMPTKSPIQAYLAQQQKSRAERAERAKAFIAAGTTAEDVAKELSGRAPIDAAMNQRKPKPGSTRPALGLPVRR